MIHLASTYKGQHQWAKAEELEERVLQTRKRVLGREHSDTLAIMNSLAWTYNKQGRFKEARKLDMQVSTSRNRTPDSRRALLTMPTDILAITDGE